MRQYERDALNIQAREVQQQPENPPSVTDTDTVSESTGAQHKRDTEVDVSEKVADRKVKAVTEDDYVREHRATG